MGFTDTLTDILQKKLIIDMYKVLSLIYTRQCCLQVIIRWRVSRLTYLNVIKA